MGKKVWPKAHWSNSVWASNLDFQAPKTQRVIIDSIRSVLPTCLSPTSPGNRSHRKTLITYYSKAMSLLRNAIKSSVSLRAIKPIHSLPSLLCQSPKHFSTETEAPPPPPPNDASIDLFLQTPTKGTNSVAFLELT